MSHWLKNSIWMNLASLHWEKKVRRELILLTNKSIFEAHIQKQLSVWMCEKKNRIKSTRELNKNVDWLPWIGAEYLIYSFFLFGSILFLFCFVLHLITRNGNHIGWEKKRTRWKQHQQQQQQRRTKRRKTIDWKPHSEIRTHYLCWWLTNDGWCKTQTAMILCVLLVGDFYSCHSMCTA